MSCRALPLAVACAAAAATLTPSASAAPMRTADHEGRAIRLDVEPGVDHQSVLAALRALIHGDEIRQVLVRVVAADEVRAVCGASASGCYQSTSAGASTIVTPGGAAGVRVIRHEYGHHLERSRRVRFRDEGSGVRHWWAARGVPGRLRGGELALDYSLGWDRSVGEVFAEDYVQLNAPGPWRIASLAAPSGAILDALRRDIERAPARPATAGAPAGSLPIPTKVIRRGTLHRGRRAVVSFGVRGDLRGIVVGVRITGRRGVPASARADVRCGARSLGGEAGATTRPISFRIDQPGPRRCALVLSRASSSITYSAAVRVTPPAASGS